MGIKIFKPTSNGRRNMTGSDFAEITKSKPEKSLIEPIRKSGGRNNTGRITSRFRGGGNKNMYRVIDFKRNKFDVPGRVAAIEYDPNRNARIALVFYNDGEKRYIIAPDKLMVNDVIVSAGEKEADIKPGNSMKIRFIPVGTFIHNVELKIGKGGQIARAAASGVQVLGKEGEAVFLKILLNIDGFQFRTRGSGGILLFVRSVGIGVETAKDGCFKECKKGMFHKG